MILLLALALILSGGLVKGQEAVVSPESWELPSRYLRDNGLRGDVVLNGYWRVTNADKVSRGIVPMGTPELKEGTLSLYREVVIPTAWKGRRLMLEVGSITKPAELYVDGNKVADIKRGKRFIEFAIPAGGETRTIEIRTGGRIQDDVWLRSYPTATAAIDDTYMMTSWRKQQATLRLGGTAPAGTSVELRASVSESPEGPAIKQFIVTTTAGADGRWRVEPSVDLAGIKFWSRYKPNLYHYTVELVVDGKVVDKVLPRRVGFREVWTENGQWMVNGVQTNYISDSWGGQLDRGGNGNPEYARMLIRALKEQGQTFSHWGPRSEAIYNVGAEEGLMCMMPAGSLVRLNIWDPRNGLTTMTGDEAEDDIERNVKRLREQPSILGWVSAASYSQASMHPEYNAKPFETWKFFPLNRDSANSYIAQQQFRRAQQIIASVDPTRTVNCHNGPWTSVDMTTKYLTNNLDLQEREEFMEDWFGRDPMFKQVVSSTEVGVPFPGEYFLRKIDFQLTQTKGNVWRIFVENAARYFGPEAYLADSDEEIANWTKVNSYAARENALYQKSHELMVRNTYRAWRTYGVNWVGHHILSEDSFVDKKRKPVEKKPVVAVDPRQPGYVGGSVPNWPLPSTAYLLPTGETLLATTKPLLAYIGGPDRRFITKDHLYYAGAEVRKAIIAINDWDDPATLKGEWTVTDPAGTVVARGPVDTTINPGQRLITELPITFNAPEVQQRTQFTINLALTSDRPGTLNDSFTITVFPAKQAAPLPEFAGTVWTLNISDDLTHETPHFDINRENDGLLKSMGVNAKLIKGLREFEYINVSLEGAMAWHDTRKLVTEGTPKPGDLLIIPRHTLAADVDGQQLNMRLLEEMKLDDLIEQGLRVLVMEQDLDNVFGLQTEDVRPRRTFIAANGHPVFDGLAESDLSYWRGSSNLSPATDPISPSDNRFPDRMWNVSNTNAVASRTPIRPQVGANRALVVSGFDLQEAPLLEVTRGKGRIIFCQMDVTNRYGIDPAATKLLDNIVRYMMTVPEPDPSKSALGASDAPSESRNNLYRAAMPEGSTAWGITHGELFFRESVFNNTYGTKPNLDVPVFTGDAPAGRPAVIRTSANGLLETTLTPDLMRTGWGKRKILWLRSALIVNQGGSTTDGPGLRHHGRVTDLYPVPWIEGFVHPYNANIW
jgi:beta-galactosidase